MVELFEVDQKRPHPPEPFLQQFFVIAACFYLPQGGIDKLKPLAVSFSYGQSIGGWFEGPPVCDLQFGVSLFDFDQQHIVLHKRFNTTVFQGLKCFGSTLKRNAYSTGNKFPDSRVPC